MFRGVGGRSTRDLRGAEAKDAADVGATILLKAHIGTRQVSGYTLVIAKSGTKVTPANAPLARGSGHVRPNEVSGTNIRSRCVGVNAGFTGWAASAESEGTARQIHRKGPVRTHPQPMLNPRCVRSLPCSAFPGLTQTQCDQINDAWYSFQVDLSHRSKYRRGARARYNRRACRVAL